MRIKRFNEELDPIKMDNGKANDMIKELEEFIAISVTKRTSIESFLQELSNYENPSNKGNDQIDDTILAMQSIKNNLDDIINDLDTSINNLKSYVDSGSSFLISGENPA